MSRIGKLPISIPGGVEVKIDGQMLSVKGAKGSLSRSIPEEIKVVIEGDTVHCEPFSGDRRSKAMWGLSRVLIFNMVVGVSDGFKKELELVGVGYRAELKGQSLSLSVGYSHPVVINPPQGVQFRTEAPNRITVEGIDKEVIGQIAADIRAVRPPEPYKGKGIRYTGEHILRKAGKTAAK